MYKGVMVFEKVQMNEDRGGCVEGYERCVESE